MRLIISERKKRHQYLRECLWQYIAEHYEIIEKTLDTDHFSEIIGIRFPSANAKVVSARVMFMMVTEGYVNINGIDVHPLVHLERMILVHGLDVDGPDFESMSKEVFSIMDEVSVVQHHPNFRLVKKSRYHLSSAKVTYSKAERFIVRKKRFFPRLENAEDKIDPRYLPTYDFFFHGIDKY